MENKNKQTFYGKLVINGETFVTNDQKEYNDVIDQVNNGKSLSEILKNQDKIECNCKDCKCKIQPKINTTEFFTKFFKENPTYNRTALFSSLDFDGLDAPLKDIAEKFSFEKQQRQAEDELTAVVAYYKNAYISPNGTVFNAIRVYERLLESLYYTQPDMNYDGIIRCEVFSKNAHSVRVFDEFDTKNREDYDDIYSFGFELDFKNEAEADEFLKFIENNKESK